MSGNRYLFIVLWFCALGKVVFAAEAVKIYRLSGEIVFDGQPFEPVWDGVSSLDLAMHRPDYGKQPSEKSEVFIAYDSEYLWVGARLYTADPSTIRSTSRKRDEVSRNSDTFTLVLDTFRDNENAMAFATMPSGLRTDYTVSNDANMSAAAQPGTPGGGTMNLSWNTFWDVKTSRDDKGWYVEMRIPFSSLRFQAEDDLTGMGIIVSRSISYRNELDTYPLIDPKFGMMAPIKPSLSAPIEFSGVKARKPVYLVPYVSAGYSSDNTLNEAETAYEHDDKPTLDAGFDLKYSLTSNLTLDLTANTDFAQVEADDQQMNLTKYSLFFPEKRLFFQERSSIFSFNLGGMSDMFYSRRIGIEDDQQVRILGGMKLIGRVGKWDLGMMDMQTQKFDTVASHNFGVLRLRRQVINPNSYVGGLITSKIGMDGRVDLAYGFDGIIKLFGEDYLDLKLAQNYHSELSNEMLSLKPTLMRANWERRSDKGFAYNVTYSYFGEQFDPEIGFLKYHGVQGAEVLLRYGWLPGEKSPVFRSSAFLQANRLVRVTDQGMESYMIGPGFELFGKSGLGGRLQLKYNREDILEAFDLSDEVQVPAGPYEYTGFEGMLFTPQSKPYFAIFMVEGGQYYDGSKFSVMARPTMSISPSFQVTGTYYYGYVNFSDRNQVLSTHVANVKLLYMMNTKLSASVLVQFNSVTHDLIGNFRLRYNPSEGNDFYVVLNDNENAGGTDPYLTMPRYFNRAFILKYTYTFKL